MLTAIGILFCLGLSMIVLSKPQKFEPNFTTHIEANGNLYEKDDADLDRF